MSVIFPPATKFPNLIFGLVGPIGVDLNYVADHLTQSLDSYHYRSHVISITKIMQEINSSVNIIENDPFLSYTSKINYANDLRKRFRSKEILAAIAIGAISKIRDSIGSIKELEINKDNVTSMEPRTAFILRQLKTPEEIQLLRRVYGKLFIQISVHGSIDNRRERLAQQISIRSKDTKNEDECREKADELIKKDYKEKDEFGQNVQDAFPLADVFVGPGSRDMIDSALDRFLSALFGSNRITPTKDEYGMYLAKTASLRSSDLSRQVGAAIFSESGEVLSLGSNEVPRPGGGTYWTGDTDDKRDFQIGHDPNEIEKNAIFSDILSRLFDANLLNSELQAKSSVSDVVEQILDSSNSNSFKKSRVMDIIEFGRIIHAEMSAICDAARNGVRVRDASMFVTTFPCHMCAKHIVGAGIKRLVYLEPYVKSYASKLHSDAIALDERSAGPKVKFEPFIGVSPLRYRDLFEKGKRKNSEGQALEWKEDPKRPIIDLTTPSYIESEKYVIAQLSNLIYSEAPGQDN